MTNNSELKEIIIYTDGGCDPNPGRGGYGAVLLFKGRRRELSGGFALTTNNRMEIMAAIVALEALKEPCRVKLHSDSKYLVDAMTLGWAKNWQTNNWRRSSGETALNPDLWERLLTACQKHLVEFIWVKGHAGNTENERCDELATQAAKALDLPPDNGYLTPSVTTPTNQPSLFELEKPSQVRAKPSEEPLDSKTKITEEGQPCRKCGTPVIKKIPPKNHKPGQLYYYAYYLHCPGCATNYMVDAAKVMLEKPANQK